MRLIKIERPIILVDMDNVVVDSGIAYRNLVDKTFPELPRIPEESIKVWDSEGLYPPEYTQKLHDLWNTPGLFANMKPVKGSLEALADLGRLNHLVLCTMPPAKSKTAWQEKAEWIKEYLGQRWLDEKRVVMTGDKTIIHGRILIDDKPSITGAMEPIWEHIVYDLPYNQETLGRRMTWKNYKEVLREFL